MRVPLAGRAGVVVCGSVAFALAHADASLRVMVGGAVPATGRVTVALFDSAESYLRKPVIEKSSAVSDEGSVSVEFAGRPRGDYAVVVAYDENDNGKLDTGLFGIPREAVGFSNNAIGRFGPAKWNDARFELGDSDLVIEIELRPARRR